MASGKKRIVSVDDMVRIEHEVRQLDDRLNALLKRSTQSNMYLRNILYVLSGILGLLFVSVILR